MKAYLNIEKKLSFFYKNYYTNRLIKGVLLFLLLGMLAFFSMVYIEYFFWLEPVNRTILLLSFILVEGFLLLFFIIKPILYLVKFNKGISIIESSIIIGNYFPQVHDKLTNLLQLKNENNPTELAKASIQQKSLELDKVQFSKAIHFRKNFIYFIYK